MKKPQIIIIYTLICLLGVYEGNRRNYEDNKRILENKIISLTIEDKSEYYKAISKWIPPDLTVEVKTPKDGWENRYRD